MIERIRVQQVASHVTLLLSSVGGNSKLSCLRRGPWSWLVRRRANQRGDGGRRDPATRWATIGDEIGDGDGRNWGQFHQSIILYIGYS